MKARPDDIEGLQRTIEMDCFCARTTATLAAERVLGIAASDVTVNHIARMEAALTALGWRRIPDDGLYWYPERDQ